MTHVFRSLVAASFATLALAGCAPSTGAEGSSASASTSADGGACLADGETALTLDAFCEGAEEYRAGCDDYVACGLWTDAAACVAAASKYDRCAPDANGDLRKLVALGLVAFDGVRAKQCSERRASRSSCTRGASGAPSTWEPDPACDAVLVGRAREGDACHSNHECADTHMCNGCPGTCVPRPKENQAYVQPSDCAPGLNAYDGRCIRRPSAGESCAPIAPSTQSRWCGSGSVCRGADQVCTPIRFLGESCDASDYCAYGTCSGGTCVRWATRGEACGFSVSGRPCTYEFTCLVNGDSSEGTCGVRANAGETCFDRWCATGLECLTPEGAIARQNPGKCEAPRGVGATCLASRVCADGLFCPGANDVAPANVCARKPTLGEACVSECDGATYCERAPGAARGVCRSKKPVGSACEVGTNQCVGANGWCESGLCVDLDPRAPRCTDARWEAAGSPALDAGAPLAPCSSVDGTREDAGAAAPDGASTTTDDLGHRGSATPDGPNAPAGQSTNRATPTVGPTANGTAGTDANTAGTDANTEGSGCSLARAPRPQNVATAALSLLGTLVFVTRRVLRRRDVRSGASCT